MSGGAPLPCPAPDCDGYLYEFTPADRYPDFEEDTGYLPVCEFCGELFYVPEPDPIEATREVVG